ncbi:MAG: DUF3097 family protein [Acidimicrobiales bacterium]|nr:DUF3097 family protein [Acidimicrobiales bacterium]
MSRPRHLAPEPLDVDGPRRRPTAHPKVAVTPGMVVEHRPSGAVGAVVEVATGRITIRDRHGRDRMLRLADGAFLVEGRPCTLVVEPTPASAGGPGTTASGSIAVPDTPARVARASRILVEGVHDAELLEKVWGDDLRVEGIVVERLDGMDDLASVVRGFGPRPGRRLGILLDHLVDRSKEQRAASAIDHPDVCITGHPYVDVWAAIRPSVVGIDAWPEVPMGEPWKEGVCARLGVDDAPGRFWKQVLGRVTSYRDLETPLVGAVEQLIDFVTEPQG